MVAATVFDILTLDLIFWSAEHAAFLAAWTAVALGVVAIWAIDRVRDALRGDVRRASVAAVRRLTVSMFCIGAVWAVPMAMLFDSASEPQRVVLVGSAAGILAGAAIALATVWQAAAAIQLAILAPAAYVLLRSGEPLYLLLLALAAAFLGKIYYLLRERGRLMVETYLTAVDLREQGQVISLLLKEFEEGASDWLFEVDRSGRLMRCGERLAALLGRPAAELVGFDLVALVDHGSPEGREAAARLAAAASQAQTVCDIVVPVRVSGARRWWSITARPVLDAGGALAGYRGVGSDVTAARHAEASIERMARCDALTGLANRLALEASLTQALGQGEAGPVAVLSLDLDRFKTVNDTLGHQIGDQLLQTVAERMRAEAGPDDVVARLGGDEFVILRMRSGRDDAASFAGRLIASIGERYDIDGYSVAVGASVGVALAGADGACADTLLRNSDLALYRAKSDGKGRMRFFEPAMDAAMQMRRVLEMELRDALRGGGLSVQFQPLIDAATGRITACEALARWTHPRLGVVSPDAFIPIAEETGLIVPLGEFVLREACAEAVKWPGGLRVAANLSPVQFKSRDLVETVRAALRDSGLPPGRLELEITESLLIDDKPGALEILTTLRGLGVRISLDDFGTGYSSLAYLSSFPFDKIKIDRSFVRDVQDREDAAAIVRAITSIAGALGMGATAEGVETQGEFDWLRQHGCGEMQGYLFSPPASPERLRELIAAQRPAEPCARAA